MKKQHLPIECAENGRKAGRQVLLKLLIMIVCAAAVFGLFGGCGGAEKQSHGRAYPCANDSADGGCRADGNADADACTACLQPGLS
ncbi:MAG: hypothetical protein ACLUZ4_01190 [Christensenellaceae bacterium]